jgi:hypothetical protein
MKPLSENQGLARLLRLKDELRLKIAPYEREAHPCSICNTPGACCLDEHFVNVRISKLEAVAIAGVIDRLPAIRRSAVVERIENVVSREKFACPLYDRSAGCLVHHGAKPAPCMIHACYENAQDLPPDDLLDQAEAAIDRLNVSVYREHTPLHPLPRAVAAAISSKDSTI